VRPRRRAWLALALLASAKFELGCQDRAPPGAQPHKARVVEDGAAKKQEAQKKQSGAKHGVTNESTADARATGSPSSGAPSEMDPWGGLTVHTLGTPLERAQRAVVLMHGYGARGDDLMPLGSRLRAGEGAAFLFPAAPFPLPNGGRAWFARDRSNLSEGYQKASALLASLRRRHPGLPIVVGGFSQGAIMTSNLLAEDASGVLAAIMLSPADALQNPPDQHSLRLPLFISHGRQDRVLPFSGSEALRDRFRAWGYPVTWVPFDGSHSIPRDVVAAINAFLAEVI
jgi:phospholipase/carboxylesterase